MFLGENYKFHKERNNERAEITFQTRQIAIALEIATQMHLFCG